MGCSLSDHLKKSEEKCWKWQQEIAKNRSAKNNTSKNSSLGISAGLGNMEWKIEVLKIEVLFLAVQVGFLFLDSP